MQLKKANLMISKAKGHIYKQMAELDKQRKIEAREPGARRQQGAAAGGAKVKGKKTEVRGYDTERRCEKKTEASAKARPHKCAIPTGSGASHPLACLLPPTATPPRAAVAPQAFALCSWACFSALGYLPARLLFSNID